MMLTGLLPVVPVVFVSGLFRCVFLMVDNSVLLLLALSADEIGVKAPNESVF